jgi:protein LTV1
MKLHQEYKEEIEQEDEEEIPELVDATKITTYTTIPRALQNEENELKEKEEVKKKSLMFAQQYQDDVDEKGVYYSETESESDDDKKWDCETILSTYTNTDNHPGVIKTKRKVVKTNQMFDMHK